MKKKLSNIVSAYKEKAKTIKELTAQEKAYFNDPIMAWQSHLYPEYHKSKYWYIGGAVITILLAAYGIYTNSWTFSVAVIIAAGVYYYIDSEKTPVIDIKIADIGIQVGERIYPYTDLKTFWIEKRAPFYEALHLVHKNQYKQEITIQTHGVNDTDLRKVLNGFLPEWEERKKKFSESLSDALGL